MRNHHIPNDHALFPVNNMILAPHIPFTPHSNQPNMTSLHHDPNATMHGIISDNNGATKEITSMDTKNDCHRFLSTDIVILILSFLDKSLLITSPRRFISNVYGRRFDCGKPVLLYTTLRMDAVSTGRYPFPDRSHHLYTFVQNESIFFIPSALRALQSLYYQRFCQYLRSLQHARYKLVCGSRHVKTFEGTLPIYRACISLKTRDRSWYLHLPITPENTTTTRETSIISQHKCHDDKKQIPACCDPCLDHLQSIFFHYSIHHPFFRLDQSFPNLLRLHIVYNMSRVGSTSLSSSWIAFVQRVSKMLPRLERLCVETTELRNSNLPKFSCRPILDGLVKGHWSLPHGLELCICAQKVDFSLFMQCARLCSQFRIRCHHMEDGDGACCARYDYGTTKQMDIACHSACEKNAGSADRGGSRNDNDGSVQGYRHHHSSLVTLIANSNVRISRAHVKTWIARERIGYHIATTYLPQSFQHTDVINYDGCCYQQHDGCNHESWLHGMQIDIHRASWLQMLDDRVHVEIRVLCKTEDAVYRRLLSCLVRHDRSCRSVKCEPIPATKQDDNHRSTTIMAIDLNNNMTNNIINHNGFFATRRRDCTAKMPHLLSPHFPVSSLFHASHLSIYVPIDRLKLLTLPWITIKVSVRIHLDDNHYILAESYSNRLYNAQQW